MKWETYTKKIQIEARVLGDLAMNHIIPVATAEFSKFAGILSAALSQYHLLRFEIVLFRLKQTL